MHVFTGIYSAIIIIIIINKRYTAPDLNFKTDTDEKLNQVHSFLSRNEKREEPNEYFEVE